jgi:hypothetical protein
VNGQRGRPRLDDTLRKEQGHILLRLTPELKDQINREAALRGVSSTWLLRKLVEEGLERLIPLDEWKMTRD